MLSDAKVSAVNRSGDVINSAASFSSLLFLSKMTSNPPRPAFQNKRVAILAELDKTKRQLQNQSMNNPGGSISLSRPNLKEFRDNAEQQHIAAQQKAALQHAHAHSSGFFITQDSSFGNLILPVLPRLEAAES